MNDILILLDSLDITIDDYIDYDYIDYDYIDYDYIDYEKWILEV